MMVSMALKGISDHDIFMCPILELMRLTFRSGHRLTVCYHSIFKAPYAVDELETSANLASQISYIIES